MDNYQNENIPNFGVAPKFVSADIGLSTSNENVDKIGLVDYTKPVLKATSLHGTGLGPNFITESTKNPEFVPFYNTGLMLNNFNASKTEPLHEIFLIKNLINLLMITTILDLKNLKNSLELIKF